MEEPTGGALITRTTSHTVFTCPKPKWLSGHGNCTPRTLKPQFSRWRLCLPPPSPVNSVCNQPPLFRLFARASQLEESQLLSSGSCTCTVKTIFILRLKFAEVLADVDICSNAFISFCASCYRLISIPSFSYPILLLLLQYRI